MIIALDSSMYLWIKALHIIAVMAWLAGLLYLPRLFVYHAGEKIGSYSSISFKVMERRLLRAIMNPAMIISLIAGAILLTNLGRDEWSQGWLHVKLICILGLIVMHMLMARYRREFELDTNYRSPRFYRILNEAVTVLMVIVVVMAVVRPF
ncbi:MAG: protoporphyrinogen oxidase HemJ [Rhodospirillales bacterium]